MTIVFTLCSNNYLAQAKALGDSLLTYNPQYKFIIGLVDRINESVDYSNFEKFQILQVEDLKIPLFNSIKNKYNLVELNTSVKSSYFKWIINSYENVDAVIYLDPDVYVYAAFEELDLLLKNYSILLTPHIITPTPLDLKTPGENSFLNYGLYNLGFLGINAKSIEALRMLDWWEERILNFGFDRVEEGFFVDQLWINLVPLYYDSVYIIKSKGYNAAPWNLHERRNMRFIDNRIIMDDDSPLYFYHFSSFKFHKTTLLSLDYNRYQFDDCNILINTLYSNYKKVLLKNNFNNLVDLKCYFNLEKIRSLELNQSIENFSGFKSGFFKKVLISLLPPIIIKLFRSLR